MTDNGDLEAQRRSLIGLAYRMLGSVADAEDVVQDALIRWHRHPDRSEIETPRAFLAKMTVRLCVDRLRSARAKREVYVGPWLPEPVVDGQTLARDAGTASELASDLSVALLLALERLSPLERAAFILHDIFDTDWAEIGAVLERSETACRKLASRARTHVRDTRPRFRPSLEERDRILSAFGAAVATGDLTALTTLLSKDAVFVGDGGGEVKSTRKPVIGSDRVARLLIGLQAKAAAQGEVLSFAPAWLNGLPGFVLRGSARRIQTATLELDETGVIRAIYVVSNPSKLRHLQ